jgi:hypothetical protein
MIGRRVGPTIVPEPNFSQRVDGDVVVLAKPENEPPRTCILRVSDIRPQTDEEDGSRRYRTLAGGIPGRRRFVVWRSATIRSSPVAGTLSVDGEVDFQAELNEVDT